MVIFISPLVLVYHYLHLSYFISISVCLFLPTSVSFCLSASFYQVSISNFFWQSQPHITCISNIYFIILLYNIISELKLLCRIAERVFSRGDVISQSVSICNLATLLLGMLRTYTTSRKVRTFTSKLSSLSPDIYPMNHRSIVFLWIIAEYSFCNATKQLQLWNNIV